MRKAVILIVFAVSALAITGYTLGGDTTQEKKKKKSRQEEVFVFQTNPNGAGPALELTAKQGDHHGYPMMAIWLEDTLGRYIQTLFVNLSMATSVYGHGDNTSGAWQPGVVRRPAALPYWSFKRGVRASDGLFIPDPEEPVADAYTGATPTGSFLLQTKTDETLQGKVNILFETNQPWDFNEYWTNGKYPEEYEYRNSAQPAVVYRATIDLSSPAEEYILSPVGHSHYSGLDGELYSDLTTLTTALDIFKEITVKVVR
jgi:hypothetical protein